MNNDFEEFEIQVERAIEWQNLIGHDCVHRSNLLLIEEGITELYEAEEYKDIRDAICDTVVVAAGALAALGYDAPNYSATPEASNKESIQSAVISCLKTSSDTHYAYLINACFDFYELELIAYNIVSDLKAVNDSNYSKFCDCPVTAKASCDKYAEQGVKAEFRRLFNGQYGIFAIGNKDIPDGKLLKGINYQEPKL